MLVSEGLNLGKILVLQLLHHEDSDEGDEADDDEVIAHVAHVKGADQQRCDKRGHGGAEDGEDVVRDAGTGVAHVGGEELRKDGGHGAEDEAHDEHADEQEPEDRVAVSVLDAEEEGEAENRRQS